ncbi:MAG: hypothetical protein E6Q60_05635 [Nitrosomonas oligotropha]|uniref:Uncharacterized protein n=1 Tax=Nitrosomonas oligotropha TaxID=42354 RepID=A0A5C7VXA0_9PROT|nr:MAG: hypothetical protein E6Q60_05635 [Nitrosomonas oligotropha]
MKKIRSPFLFFCAFFLPVSYVNAVDISGIWTSDDYQCPAGVKHTEKIKIEKHDSVFTAIKLQGDDCINTGYLTFFFDSNTNLCRILATPSSVSASSLFECKIIIVDDDNFVLTAAGTTAEGVVFSKESSLPAVTVAPNLNISIPHVNYTFPDGTKDLWVDLQYVPSSDGNLLWKLNDYGINPK